METGDWRLETGDQKNLIKYNLWDINSKQYANFSNFQSLTSSLQPPIPMEKQISKVRVADAAFSAFISAE